MTTRLEAPPANSPFQATKLWNQMIRNFREGIELKKRRWKMKLYEKTFSGSDAVDWFLLYLRSNQKFGNHVTRVQAKQLLQKFLENGIFEDARGKDTKSFEDDNHLYRFTEKADEICQNKKELASQRSVTNLIRSVSIRRDKNPNVSTDSEGVPKIVRNRNLRRVARSQSMRQALLSSKNSLLPSESIGVTPLSKNFTQITIDSAKKSSDEESQNALGDSVNSAKDQTEAVISSSDEKENNPTMQRTDLDRSIDENYSSILQEAGIDNRAFIVEEMSPLVGTFTRTRSLRDPKAMRYRHKFVVSCDEEDSGFEPSLNLHKSLRRSLKRSKSNGKVTGIKFTKTDHCSSPSKKLKTEGNNANDADTIARVNTSGYARDGLVYGIKENKGDACTLRRSGNSDTSNGQIKNEVKVKSRVAAKASSSATEKSLKDDTLFGLEKALEVESLDDYINLTLVTDIEIEANINTELKSAEIPEWVLSAMKFLVNWPNEENCQKDSSLPSYEGFEKDVFHAVQDHYESTLKEPLMTFNLFKLLDLASETITKSYTRAISIFQYLSLIIPLWNRKQIYLILRFMDKVSKNLELKLNATLSNNEVVVQSLHSIIIRNKEMQFPEHDTKTSITAVTFMIENHEQILKVPFELKSKLDQTSTKMSLDPTPSYRQTLPTVHERPTSYCVQCTKEEYNKQAEDLTRKALVDLLNMIANDDTLPQKIKRKRLKGFKKNYPEIYQRKFPEDNISTCSTTSQRTLKIRQAIRPIFFKHRNSDF